MWLVVTGDGGGYCEVVSSRLQQGRQITITQNIPAGDTVSSIVVGPPGRQVGSPDLS